MTDPVNGAELLEQIPHGYLWLRGDEVLFANRSLRSLFEQDWASLPALVWRYPQLAFLQQADGPTASWVDIDGCLFNVRLFSAGDGRIACFLPGHELSDADANLQALQHAYDDFVEIFQNCFDGIYVADGDGKTLWMNAGFERCYGLSARQFIGRNAAELEREGYVKPLITWKIITTRQRATALQETKSGRKILATGIPLLDASGRVRKVIINSRDTTELVALQDRLDDAEREIARYEQELAQLQKEAPASGELVWKSRQMQQIVDLSLRVAGFDSTLLITGESGVGKEAVAQMIHRHSDRRDGAFLQINCGAIPGELLESELLGYEEGAFTGSRRQGKKGLLELADGGTLFLDEIGEMPLDLQVKLLRVLQDQAFTRLGGTREIRTDFRIIAATNRDLTLLVREGHFREDLFYRLSVIPIEVPPLRERPEDVIVLCHRFLDFFNTRYGLARKLSARLLDQLVRQRWPGNVRELRNLIERLVVTATEDVIDLDCLPGEALPAADDEPGEVEALLPAGALRARVAAYEARLLRRTVEHCGSIRKAALATGISESTIKRKLRPTSTSAVSSD